MRSLLSRFPSLFAALLITLTAPLAAQQKVCLSVHQQDPLIPAAGVNAMGMPAKVTAHVAGQWILVFPSPGDTDAEVSQAHEDAFQAAGFTTARVNDREFCITKAPNGADVTKGVVYEITDLNLDKDSKVYRNETASNPTTKDNGVLIGLPLASQPPVPFGATIDAHLMSLDHAGTLTTTLVTVSIPPLVTGALMQAEIRQQFEAAGFFGNIVLVVDPANASGLVEVLQLERTATGRPIVGIEIYWDYNSRLLMRTITGAGVEPVFGASEYGVATTGLATTPPWSHVDGAPQVGGTFDIVHEMQVPDAIAIHAMALAAAPVTLPVFNGFLLVDPSTMLLELGLSDELGASTRSWSIPPNPLLMGFELVSQAVVLAPPGGPDSFSTGIRISIRP